MELDPIIEVSENSDSEMEVDNQNVVNDENSESLSHGLEDDLETHANEEEDVIEQENVDRINLENEALPNSYVEQMDAEVTEQFLDNKDDLENAGPLGAPIFRQLTMIRLCDDECPTLDSNVANALYKLLTQLVQMKSVLNNNFLVN